MLVLNIEGSPRVQVVHLDDEYDPSYAAKYVQTMLRYLDPAIVLRWCQVDISTVADYGPNEIAKMLSGDEEYATDLPQEWILATRWSAH